MMNDTNGKIMSCFENYVIEHNVFELFTKEMIRNEELSDIVKMELYTPDEFFEEIKQGVPHTKAQLRIFKECLEKNYDQTLRNFYPVIYNMVEAC